MNRIFQPHESHIPFLLQFKVSHWPVCTAYGPAELCNQSHDAFPHSLVKSCMQSIKHGVGLLTPVIVPALPAQIDFNLYGMGQLRLGNALFRHPVPEGPHLRHGWADSPNLHLPEGTLLVLIAVQHSLYIPNSNSSSSNKLQLILKGLTLVDSAPCGQSGHSSPTSVH